MSEHTGKRKRSLQDSIVDISKIRTALSHLEALKEELDGIEETEEELYIISEHLLCWRINSRRVTFSTVALEDLKKVGVRRRRLIFDPTKVAELTNALTTNEMAEIANLHSRIKQIYAHVNMDHEPGSRMILDAILLALTEISESSTQKNDVAILPEIKIAPEDAVQLFQPISGYELWLSGKIDYAVVEYEDVKDYKGGCAVCHLSRNCFIVPSDRLLAPGGSREDAFEISKGRLILVKAKRQALVSHIPETISQAIALLKSANLPEVRFCLSDGHAWVFFILKLENEVLTYYESATRRLSRDVLEHSDLPLREVVQLVREWLRPTATEPFVLE